ncbi:ABC transporter permease [Actinotignum timonense]|uniref:ABC transporter permease n=1 Tax=Actinomycetaceae TaxID=2049 RepID=UPI00254EA17F|nr:ABC transporter permease [Actinotignum timonense]MDK6906137.1 ABC transporter permease [Actinotignum timonense]
MAAEREREVSPEAQVRFEKLAGQDLTRVAIDTGFFSGWRASVRDIFDHRHLLGLLTRRELKARYKDSVLGYVWTLVRPLINLLIYYFAIGKVLGAERAIPDFAIYVFAGLTAWGLFSQIVAASTGAIVSNSGIVKKVYLPREIFPLSAAGAAFVDFLSQLAILVCGALIIRGVPWGSALIYFPISLAVVVVWAVAFGLFLSAANVYLRDVQYLVEVILLIGFWLTPSVYSFAMIAGAAPSWMINLYLLNPTSVAVMGFQHSFWAAGQDALLPSHLLTRLGIFLIIGLVLLWLAQRYFARMQRNFAQEL